MKQRLRQQHPRRAEQRRGDGSVAESAATDSTENAMIADSTARVYDDALIDRSRDQWRRGDWEALSQLSADEMERNPNRARLALMAAAAHQANGNAAQTRLFVRLASQWGCDSRLVARTLLAGVHNTLGRAAAAGGKHRDRALYHFNEAVAPGSAGASRWMVTQGRVRQQLEQLRLGSEATTVLAGGRGLTLPSPPIVAAPFRELGDALRQNGDLLSARLKEQADQLTKMRNALDGTVKKEVGNAVKQLEAFANLQRYFGEGELVPELHGWPISADFGVLLVEIIEASDLDIVIEFGSGTSTVLLAKAIATRALRSPGAAPVVQVAFEHLLEYHSKTRSALEKSGLADRVILEHAPLRSWMSSRGEQFQYYTCERTIESIVDKLPGRSPKILIVVDGPPASSGKCARYPAVPIVISRFPTSELIILLDDHARPDEQRIAEMWIEDLHANGRLFEVSKPAMEKGAILLSVRGDASAIDVNGRSS